MPVYPGHRVDVLFVPGDAERPAPERLTALRSFLVEQGWALADGTPGPHADALIPGGFARLRLDIADGVGLYHNGQGGFSVSCPTDGRLITAAFAAWRAAHRTELAPFACGCGQIHDPLTLQFTPPVALARYAVIVSDVATVEPRAEAVAALTGYLPNLRRLWRRS